jgi:hypothetical protein
MSPWFGLTSANNDVYNSGDKEGYGDYLSVPHSYGFWGSSPSIGTQVICVFINGNPNDGYYIGCAPTIGLTHMVPAIAAAATVVPNTNETKLYSGADRLPVTEANFSNLEIRNNTEVNNAAKPIHSYQASVLAKQGIVRDNLRGVITSSSQRETPSRVYGMSTPGNSIYEGGYTSANIREAMSSADQSKLQVVGRTGGHSIVMDDGTIDGYDQLLRLRTSAGHMIMMNDSAQILTILHSNGQTWVEFGKEGTIDVFSTNSVNFRTQGDFNIHADRDINLHAKRNISCYSNSTKIETETDMSVRTGKDFTSYHSGKYTVKVDQQMSLASKGDSSFLSESSNYQNGRMIYLNTGASATVPGIVPNLVKNSHVETTFSQNAGWMNPAPENLESITTRTPAHMPWAEGNKGVAL